MKLGHNVVRSRHFWSEFLMFEYSNSVFNTVDEFDELPHGKKDRKIQQKKTQKRSLDNLWHIKIG